MSYNSDAWYVNPTKDMGDKHIGTTVTPIADFESEDDAARAVKCVNAFNGVANPEGLIDLVAEIAEESCAQGNECGDCFPCRALALLYG